ncbi:MAG TPA: ABC transporter substrate-binding protein [Clostridiaceae bacterium]|nr:ABC transporter substrate-binding protein [Clostridiaceae bacterium]
MLCTLFIGCASKDEMSASGTQTQEETKEQGSQEQDSQKQDKKDLPVLRVAMMPFITCLPTEYIRKNELDIKNGFRMETIMFASGAPMNEALAADLWDVGSMGAAAVTGVANYDMVIIGEVLESQDGLAIFARPDSDIVKVKGYNPSFPEVYGDPDTVRGKTIVLPVGTAMHFNALKWLEKIGLKADDVNIVNMEVAQAYQAFKSGQADLVGLNVPTFFDAIRDGMVQVGNLAYLGVKYVDMVTANKKSIEEKPELIQKFMNLIVEACEALNADQEMAVKLMMDYSREAGAETSEENVRSDLERLKFLTKEDLANREIGAFAKELGEFYISIGQLEPDLMEKFKTNINDTFVKNAIK